MSYYISPNLNPISHKAALTAEHDSGNVDFGTTIAWRKNGTPIKSGLSNIPANLSINTGDPSDINFIAADTNAVIDFWIDPPDIDPEQFSNPVILSNNAPTISGAGPVTDAYSRTLGRPKFVWTYADADSDPQNFYQVKVGSAVGLSDYHDSGLILSTDQTYTIPSLSAAIPVGATYYWTIDVGDGAYTTPIPVLVRTTATGVCKVNTPPVVSNVQINGVAGGTIATIIPVFTWTYTDLDSQPQFYYRIRVATNAGFTSILWDSGNWVSTDKTSVYNFNLTGSSILPHTTLYVGIRSFDGLEESIEQTASFVLSNKPIITTLTVDSKVNPLNVRNLFPFFNWKYTDLDNDPLTRYEIRVADNDGDLGTDSFIGNIWSPGVVTIPESYGVKMDSDGSAFPGCVFPKAFVNGVRYFVQVKAYDAYDESDWFTGFFQLNNPPTAVNVRINPSAPYANEDLYALYDFVDDVGDVESDRTQIKWYKKEIGASFVEQISLGNTKIVPHALTAPNQQWKFTVRPHDGCEYSVLDYTSNTVTILNRVPTASALAITPGQPRTSDNLEAIFAVSDPDEQPVKVFIFWYKNGVEQTVLRNTKIIPASVTNVDEEWYFEVIPNDGYANGPTATSPKVTILNTPPTISSISVESMFLPKAVKNQNPTISWAYQDDDLQPQQKYQFVLGTKPARTKKTLTNITTRALPSTSAGVGLALSCTGTDGIISSAKSDGTIVAGNELFDSGVIESENQFFQYVTEDSVKEILLTGATFQNLTNYTLSPDLQTLSLRTGETGGTAIAQFTGTAGFYNVELTYAKEQDKKSLYKLNVDGVLVESFTSQPGIGNEIYTFNAIQLDVDSNVGINGIAVDTNARAKFVQLRFIPVVQLELNAGDFATLSGYISDGTGGIKLAGIAGTATTAFSFPSGTYDIEFIYVQETSGHPQAIVTLNSGILFSITYDQPAKIKSAFLSGVSINNGDTIKISGTRSGGALARVKKMIFRPTSTTKVGSKLKEGLQYFASIRVYDGQDWSDWYTTKFVMSGSAWAAGVSNATGWTIETRIQVTQVQQLSVADQAIAILEAL